MKNVKELARMLTDGITYEDAWDELKKPIDDDIDKQNQKFEDVFFELMDELSDLMVRQKRPVNSAVKQIIEKSDSVKHRANKLAGGDVFANNLFVIQFAIVYSDEDEGQKKLLQYFNSQKQLNEVCRTIETSPEYRRLIAEQKRDEDIAKNFHPFAVTPFDKLIENPSLIMMEILESFAAIGQYHRVGFTLDMIMPLIQRTQFLDLSYKLYKKITKELVDEFEADKVACIKRLHALYEEGGGKGYAVVEQ